MILVEHLANGRRHFAVGWISSAASKSCKEINCAAHSEAPGTLFAAPEREGTALLQARLIEKQLLPIAVLQPVVE